MERSILRRFAQLVSAQGVEGALVTLFFLYLAWIDSTLYGTVIYGMAAGGVALKVIEFGLYYPLVAKLGKTTSENIPKILNQVNLIKLLLLAPTMAAVFGIGLYRRLSTEMTLVLVVICLGFAVEAIAETFFADFRVRGKQNREAKVKVTASVASYAFGFAAAALSLSPVIVAMFKLVASLVRIVLAVAYYLRDYTAGLFVKINWTEVSYLFKSASVFALIEILGVTYNRTNIFFLESAAGVEGVAYYGATYNLLDSISIMGSDQFLGWVIFPLLASLWWKDKSSVARLVKSNATWLMALALPIMFFLHSESSLIIGLVYPQKYQDAVWMQQYLVWTILFSFESNLFCYVMMVAGAAKVLLLFTAVVTLLNLVYNLTLVSWLGLAGGCLVIVLTKMSMAVMAYSYCRFRLKFLTERDFAFPIILAAGCYIFFLASKAYIGLHLAVASTLIIYLTTTWKVGPKFIGPLPGRGPARA